MSRREQREQLFKLLFRVEFNKKEEMPQQLAFFLEEIEEEIEQPLNEEEEASFSAKFESIMDCLEELDRRINEKTERWSTDRMGKVELTLLRIAVYEICFDEDIPTGVAINEAVELAKKFGQEESRAFINGVLARFAGDGT